MCSISVTELPAQPATPLLLASPPFSPSPSPALYVAEEGSSLEACAAKINELQLAQAATRGAGASQQDVLRLQVAVDDGRVTEHDQRVQDLGCITGQGGGDKQQE